MTVERRNPYPGLRPFREDEEYLFFGRESQTDAMVDKLAQSRLLAVVGTSGSGKSSLVNCGLRPALHRGLMASAGTSWRIWETPTSKLLFSSQLTGEIEDLTFGPHGRVLAATSGTEIGVLNASTGILIGMLKGHEFQVHSLAISHDGRFLASANGAEPLTRELLRLTGRHEVRIWNLESLESLRRWQGKGLVRALTFTSNDQFLVFGVNDDIEVWDVAGQQLSPVLRGHSGLITYVGVTNTTHSDHFSIVSASEDGTLRYWDFPTQPSARRYHHQEPVNGAAFSIDSGKVGTGGAEGTVTLWDVRGREPQSSFEVESVMTLGFDNEGGAIGTTRGLWLVDHQGTQKEDVGGTDVWALDFTPDGRFVITAGSNGKLYKWDRSHKKAVTEFRGHDGKVRSLDVSPDGREVVSAGDDGTVRFWDLATGKSLGEPLEGHKGEVVAVKFIPPDGRAIVSGGWDGTLRIWGRDRSLRHTFKAHEGLESVAVSADGRYLASGGSDQVIRVWLPDGSLIGQFLAHAGYISSVEFGTAAMPDASGIEQVILSASRDGTAALWPSRLWKDDWKSALHLACERLRHHPLLSKPTSSVAQDACLTCEEFVWKEAVCSEPSADFENLWTPTATFPQRRTVSRR